MYLSRGSFLFVGFPESRVVWCVTFILPGVFVFSGWTWRVEGKVISFYPVEAELIAGGTCL